ncbi:MAG: nitronate monooxygenase [Nitriliruptoraceae bacterium]
MLPVIIQGGMGVGVSSWQLARTVAELGQLGVVSGTATAVTHARRLADGDPGGHTQRALEHFPFPHIAERVLDRHLNRGSRGARFPGLTRPKIEYTREQTELTVAANFAEVFLARDGAGGPVGINFLEKIQMPTLPSIYGAMLAGVDFVLMGAGIPARIPAVIDGLHVHKDVSLPINVVGDTSSDRTDSHFSPTEFAEGAVQPDLDRPMFLAIVSSATLATYLDRNSAGSPDGFVVEMPTAGGHNAPPRGKLQIDEDGEPMYGPRDRVDLEVIAGLGKPFWLAGGYGTAEQLQAAQAHGAVGVQVGTAFAFCEESGLDPQLRRQVLDQVVAGEAHVRTDVRASPTGFPFKVIETKNTLSDGAVYAERPRKCDIGYLREAYRKDDGGVGYRCAAEPVDDWIRKGGDPEAVEGRQCLCNGLMSTIGLGQVRREGYAEAPIMTAGDDLSSLTRYLEDGRTTYHARDVIERLLGVTADT